MDSESKQKEDSREYQFDNITSYLIKAGKKVLVIDLGLQGNVY